MSRGKYVKRVSKAQQPQDRAAVERLRREEARLATVRQEDAEMIAYMERNCGMKRLAAELEEMEAQARKLMVMLDDPATTLGSFNDHVRRNPVPGCVIMTLINLYGQRAEAAARAKGAKVINDRKKEVTDPDVLEAQRLYAEGNWSQEALAEHFGVGQPTISRWLRKIACTR
jgi:hypothetical protein